jgi:hypothetical protein
MQAVTLLRSARVIDFFNATEVASTRTRVSFLRYFGSTGECGLRVRPTAEFARVPLFQSFSTRDYWVTMELAFRRDIL